MEGMWSLIFFTLLAQAASGMVLWQSLITNATTCKSNCWPKLALALALFGMVFSLLHLSAPMHSVFTVNNIFFSWLSREIFCVGLFVASLGLYIYTPSPLTLYVSTGAAILLNYSMSKIYTESLVPYWQDICVFGYFLSSSLVLGALTLGILAFLYPASPTGHTIKERLSSIMKSSLPVALTSALALRISFGIEHATHKIDRINAFALHAAPILLAFSFIFVLLLQRQGICAGHDAHKGHKCTGFYTICALVLAIFIVVGEVLGRVTFYQGYTWFGM